jgi:peptidoglycan/LPS O-acetylase OafA/YrhL
LIVPGWTLNYEMFFYLLLGASLLVSSRFRHAALSLTLLALVCVGLVLKPHGLLAFYTSPLLLEFLLGYLFGLAYLRGISFAPVTCMALAVVSLVILFGVGPMVDPIDWQRFLRWGIPTLGLVVGVVLWDRASPFPELRLAHAAGDASYAIYLVQFVCVSAFEKAWQKLGVPITGISQLGFLLCGTSAVSIFGWIVHRYVERPMARGIKWIVAKPQFA